MNRQIGTLLGLVLLCTILWILSPYFLAQEGLGETLDAVGPFEDERLMAP